MLAKRGAQHTGASINFKLELLCYQLYYILYCIIKMNFNLYLHINLLFMS